MARRRRHRGVVSQALDDIFKNFDLLGDYVGVVFDALNPLRLVSLRLIGVGSIRGKVFKALVCLIGLNEGVDYRC